jgi:hypothetical protein
MRKIVDALASAWRGAVAALTPAPKLVPIPIPVPVDERRNPRRR